MSQEQADDLKRQLADIIPNNYTIEVKYIHGMSETMHVIIADMNTLAHNVTLCKSKHYVRLIMHMKDHNPAWKKLFGRGIPFRRLSPTKHTTASERLIKWAERTFAD